jgi:hypothetical protein
MTKIIVNLQVTGRESPLPSSVLITGHVLRVDGDRLAHGYILN